MARGRHTRLLLTAAVAGALMACGVGAGAALARQSQARQVLKVTKLRLSANQGVRLQEGHAVQAAEATIWLMPSSRFWQLQPSHGTVLATDGVTTKRGPWGCKAARWGSPVASEPLRAGQFFCVMTKSGDYGEIKIESVTPTGAVISYTLWDGL
jgi:hypothetical protein